MRAGGKDEKTEPSPGGEEKNCMMLKVKNCQQKTMSPETPHRKWKATIAPEIMFYRYLLYFCNTDVKFVAQSTK